MKSSRLELKRPQRRVLAAIGIVAGVLIGGPAVAGASGNGAGDLAVGSASSPYPTAAGPGSTRVSVDAHSDPSGLDPRGHVEAHGTTGGPMGEFKVAGPVTCLRVEGNKAAIKYPLTRASGSAAMFKGDVVELFIEDNGPPRNGQPVDEVASLPPAPESSVAAGQCDDPNTADYEQVTSGNYTVRDGGAKTAPGGQP